MLDQLYNLLVAIMASAAVGLGVSFLIQLGKLFIPKWFPDASADNWRLGLSLLAAIVVLVLRLFGIPIELANLESVMNSLAALGGLLMPLLVLIASWVAKTSYINLWKGVVKIGFSWSDRPKLYISGGPASATKIPPS
jgi:hypothetical protein